MSFNGLSALRPVRSREVDGRRCVYCGRYDDDVRGHNCASCGAWIAASKFIDVTTLCDLQQRLMRVPA